MIVWNISQWLFATAFTLKIARLAYFSPRISDLLKNPIHMFDENFIPLINTFLLHNEYFVPHPKIQNN